ncbi:hypothetical protein BU26DRAFT_517680 [Trematosphaeria pertusa]|uniref:F-box domain-containing protein n=1 Tax=Trematosphaeria pertusa TaxID=390896 RepID=A0A6A6IJW9_9PLEO|nr:uncharacterized protein BU26DRAFT_517680 [Trematosphaeria pertusa]KAF2250895.1 hypothetical protein BU26DRAFT_517680 [Trematosphaeria pertusa]
MATSALLTLPTELRLHLYDFVVPEVPLSVPASQYTGLLYSCTRIRDELQPEILKHMTAFLLEMQSHLRTILANDFEFTLPQSYSELQTLTVTRPYRFKPFRDTDPFLRLTYLHFKSITLRYRAPPKSSNPDYAGGPSPHRGNMRRLLFYIAKYAHWPGSSPCAKRIVYDWSRDQEHDNTNFPWTDLGWLAETAGWSMEPWRDEEGKIIGAVLVRVDGPGEA